MINISTLHDQTGPTQGVWNSKVGRETHLLSVGKTSSVSSNVSSHSTSSGYCSHGWSEISSTCHLVESDLVRDTPPTLAQTNPSSPTRLQTGDSSTPVSAQLGSDEDELSGELREDKVQRCKYCNKQFEYDEEVGDELCPSAPNKCRESIDRICCVRCYKGAWYHMTKDSLEDEGQDIGRCVPAASMTTGYWCMLGILSVFCAPCLICWCPLSICELAAQQAGVTGGPHSLTTIKKKTTMVPSKKKDSSDEEYGGNSATIITSQPSSSLAALTVRISLPDEDSSLGEEEAAQQRMMGFHVEDSEEEGQPGRRITPAVQRAQSELVPDRKCGNPGAIQRSMSESRN